MSDAAIDATCALSGGCSSPAIIGIVWSCRPVRADKADLSPLEGSGGFDEEDLGGPTCLGDVIETDHLVLHMEIAGRLLIHVGAGASLIGP